MGENVCTQNTLTTMLQSRIIAHTHTHTHTLRMVSTERL